MWRDVLQERQAGCSLFPTILGVTSLFRASQFIADRLKRILHPKTARRSHEFKPYYHPTFRFSQIEGRSTQLVCRLLGLFQLWKYILDLPLTIFNIVQWGLLEPQVAAG